MKRDMHIRVSVETKPDNTYTIEYIVTTWEFSDNGYSVDANVVESGKIDGEDTKHILSMDLADIAQYIESDIWNLREGVYREN